MHIYIHPALVYIYRWTHIRISLSVYLSTYKSISLHLHTHPSLHVYTYIHWEGGPTFATRGELGWLLWRPSAISTGTRNRKNRKQSGAHVLEEKEIEPRMLLSEVTKRINPPKQRKKRKLLKNELPLCYLVNWLRKVFNSFFVVTNPGRKERLSFNHSPLSREVEGTPLRKTLSICLSIFDLSLYLSVSTNATPI